MIALSTIVYRLKNKRPTTPQDFLRKCRLPLEYLDCGAFRETFSILRSHYVIKFPITEWNKDEYPGPRAKWLRMHVNHSRTEIDTHQKILRSRKPAVMALAKYLPEMPWADWDSGVILQRRYETCPSARWNGTAGPLLAACEAAATERAQTDHDIARTNCGIDSAGNLKILDMGNLEVI